MFFCVDAITKTIMSHCVDAMSHCVDTITKAIMSR